MYLDPGFGSMVIQALIATIAAAAAMIGIFRVKIKTFFKEFFKKDKKSDEKKNDE